MLKESLRPVSRSSLSDGIVEQIIDLISRGALKPGERIPSEKQLGQQFCVGRTSVREALRSLAVMGVLETHAGDGTYVSENSSRYLEKALRWGLVLDRKVLKDLIETRLMLECQTAYIAATRAKPDDLIEIRKSIEGMETAIELPDRYLEFDVRFHLGVARSTQNSILHTLLSMIRGHLQAWIRDALGSSSASDADSRAELSIREHRRILERLEARDADGARVAMRAHILSSSSDLRAGGRTKLMRLPLTFSTGAERPGPASGRARVRPRVSSSQ